MKLEKELLGSGQEREREEKKRILLIGFLTEFLNGEINKFFFKNMKLTEQLTESNGRT